MRLVDGDCAVTAASVVIDLLVAHALEEAPNECCGLIGLFDGALHFPLRATNCAPLPELAYEIEGREQWELENALALYGLEVGAIYHSHTRADARPSTSDVELARYPELLYVIVGVRDPHAPEVRVFRVVERGMEEVNLDIRLPG
jgi:proteasome lid subunit RPN8/RPN11